MVPWRCLSAQCISSDLAYDLVEMEMPAEADAALAWFGKFGVKRLEV
jgi:hypothetical protein